MLPIYRKWDKLSILQDRLLEILGKSSAYKSTRELLEDIQELTDSRHRLSTIHRALLALEKFDMVELRKEKAYGGRHGYHCFWRIKEATNHESILAALPDSMGDMSLRKAI
jgi:hypothetical protein